MDLLDETSSRTAMASIAPDVVVGAAALVGGIAANVAEPVRFLVDNTVMQNNLMTSAADTGVSHLIFMSSSCVYPRESPQPMEEAYMMTGPLEPTNESYAIAKLAGMQLARALQDEGRLRSSVLIPSNIYGPGDSFNPERSHVASALVKKFVDAKRAQAETVPVWGTGKARRELTHSDDLASATEFVISNGERLPFAINVGTGTDHSIAELAEMISDMVGFQGSIVFDPSKPDGMPRKVLDTKVLTSLGWRAAVPLEMGIRQMIREYRAISEAQSDSGKLKQHA